MYNTFRKLVVFATIWLSASAAYSQGKADLLKPNFTNSERFGETFTASFLGKDGSVFLFQYVFSNAGFGDKKAACRLLSVPKGSRGKNQAQRVDRDGWTFNQSKRTLTVGKCSLQDEGGTLWFRTEFDGVKTVLHIDGPLRPRRFPKLPIKKGFFEAEVLAADGNAFVSFGKKGASLPPKAGKNQLFGRAYFDHTRSTAVMSDMFSAVYRVRLLKPDETILFNVSTGPLGTRGWSYFFGDTKLAPLAAGDIQIRPNRSKPSLTVNLPSGIAKVTTERVVYRYRPVESYGMLGRMASPIIGNPETTTFIVNVTLADGTIRKGLMERTLVEP